MNRHSVFSRLCHSPIPHRAAVLLIALAWSSIAFGGEIHDAAKVGDLEKVKAMLKDNPDLVFSKDNHGETPLHWAANKEHKDVVEFLLASKVEVNAKDNTGWTPLHWAAFSGRKNVAALLLANRAEVNAKSNSGRTPLHLAAGIGDKDVVELLLANKAEVNARNNTGETPLYYAAYRGHKAVVELLLANKAEVNAKNKKGETPLHLAAAKVAADFRRYVTPIKKAKPGFYLVGFGANGPHTELVEVAACPTADADELALHYGADFVAWEQQWLSRLAHRHSGVTILFGPPGVGKTSYLKMLMARFIDRFVFYYLPISSFELLSSPQFVGFWLDENRRHDAKAKLAIIEDAESLLLPRDERSRAQVSNLLNIGDGFLGEHLKLHVVATTNAPMRRMDEAVLRPGRLMGTREFRRLTHAEALRLAQAKGLTLANGSDTWSLAEIYNGQPEVLAPEPSVGFSCSE